MITGYAVFEAGGTLRPYQYDPGPLGSHQVEIAVEYCGLCHSDLSMINNDWGVSQYPFIPGHEAVGRIAAVGELVTQFTVGDAVGLGWQSGFCHTCDCCMNGDHNLCYSVEETIVGRHGGFADRVRAAASSVVAIPPGIPLQQAGPLFCAGVTTFNPLMQQQLSPTARVAVIGIGGLGHLALQFLKAWGCEVTAFTSSPDKAEEARRFGAHEIINSRDSSALKAARNHFDLIISTVNVKLEWQRYIATLKPKGKLVLLGVLLEPLDISLIGQRAVMASEVGSPGTIKTMLDFAARHGIVPQTEVMPMSAINQALSHLEAGKPRYRIVLQQDVVQPDVISGLDSASA
ncbi:MULTISPECIES: NAD(P)-dependent alcohol dehydrogenase [unclassified Oceanobacter]|uniref:NADPH-dependent aldehyde reductase Ahr n=1 Tax=unclassified Oceanobacter TaxID=2620260 RepID=UPI0026E372F1|nr:MULTISPECIES: NAD(P)-dependent alcohol dehydrogenase [unclassified Oceanobacter]MDO6682335.1 NAD(P)-dependent alcohol dehydrogenase [Oceanobacter sp. 5_MG-2023]MDP2608982.1 NAD(P)-dependent alcohol dehydrogenase [Oceanobacter sp. 1_MG-2023]MDP2612033.1 NAD(P)-dependent alcohol dehydrogenase [Oceanobacter sp. 2_MG-2023]